MESSERQPFENNWQDAFRGSEATPSDTVWLSIESSLAGTQNEINKKRIVYYQRLAAGLLILFTASMLLVYWQWDRTDLSQDFRSELTPTKTQSTKEQADKTNPDSSAVNSKTGEIKRIDNTGVLQADDQIKQERGASDRPTSNKERYANTGKKSVVNEYQKLSAEGMNQQTNPVEDSLLVFNMNASVEKADAHQSQQQNSIPLTEEQEKEFVKKMLAESGVATEEEQNKKLVMSNPSWLSIGYSGGSYAAPGLNSITSPLDFSSNAGSALTGQSPPDKTQAGTSYSIGVMVGKKFAKRWLIQTGFTYLNRRLDYESNVIIGSANSQTVYYPGVNSASGSSYSFANQYTITSTSEFISLPAQIGFVLVDRKVGWTINAGAAADFFLKNTLTDRSGNYRSVTESRGDDGAYKSLTWSGIANTEVVLKLSKHYRFAFVPGIRYSITNIVKDDAGNIRPLTLDIGFRFRYVF